MPPPPTLSVTPSRPWGWAVHFEFFVQLLCTCILGLGFAFREREREREKKTPQKQIMRAMLYRRMSCTSERAGHENKFKSAFSSVFSITLLVVDNLHD